MVAALLGLMHHPKAQTLMECAGYKATGMSYPKGLEQIRLGKKERNMEKKHKQGTLQRHMWGDVL